jgi:signal transduction histidine kinase
MTARTARRIALTGFVTIVGCLAAQLLLLYLNRSRLSAEQGDQFLSLIFAVSILAMGGVGALIASRQPGNIVGWGFLWSGSSFALAIFLSQYAARALVVAPGSLPFGRFAAWIQNWFEIPGAAAVVFIFLLFPNGRVPSRRWRPVLWLAEAATALLTLAWALKPGVINQSFGSIGSLHVTNPVGIGHPRGFVDTILLASTFAILAAAAASIVSLVVRFRSTTGEEHQQIRWLALTAAGIGLLFLFNVFFAIAICPHEGGACTTAGDVLFVAFFTLAALGIPVASAVAILKYRLYDLDLVVKKTVVFALVAAFITIVYVLFVIAVPTLIVGLGAGGGFSPLSLLTTVVVALLFQPVRARARRVADRIVYGSRATPYEVLSEFSERLADAYSTDDVLPRMAELVRGSSGASSVRIAVLIGGELMPSAWSPDGRTSGATFPIPPDEPPPLEDRVQAFPVRHQGDLLGAIELELPANDPMTPAKRQLVQDLASQAGLVLRNVRLIEELRASRRRIVTAQDERAKKLERNIHDGAQQRLVALSVKLRLAEQLTHQDAAKAGEMLAQLQTETTETLEELRDLARGIYPPLLADRGLPEALEAQARKSPLPVAVESDGTGRYPQELEAAVYFSCLEALQNVAKYANASSVRVRLNDAEGLLVFEVEDDGAGFDVTATRHGSGLQGMADRLEALGGTLEIRSSPGNGTIVIGRVPTSGGRPGGGRTEPQPDFAASQADSNRSGPKTALGM